MSNFDWEPTQQKVEHLINQQPESYIYCKLGVKVFIIATNKILSQIENCKKKK